MAARYLGKPIRRNEDPRLLRGKALFVDDIDRAGLRSLIQNDGATSSFKETAPNRNASQVIGLEFWMRVIGIDGVGDRCA